jgi:hypothetical protein
MKMRIKYFHYLKKSTLLHHRTFTHRKRDENKNRAA